MHDKIMEFLGSLLPELSRRGIALTDEREISYGWQLRLLRDKAEVVLNIYYSDKKGLSTVIGGDTKSALSRDVASLTATLKPAKTEIAMHHWKHWIGSDECGKGDYFGALVGCAVAVNETMINDMRAIGVTDSKLVRDRQIEEIAKRLYRKYKDSINCLVLKPQKYNELYDSFRAQGKNLNDLMAWLHYTLIRGLVERSLTHNIPMDGVLVDQFSTSSKVQRLCHLKHLGIPVIERHRAETDVAVAAASIIARYQFLQAHRAMREHYQIDFPLGSGARIGDIFRQFINTYSAKRLHEVAKLHFKTTAKYHNIEYIRSGHSTGRETA